MSATITFGILLHLLVSSLAASTSLNEAERVQHVLTELLRQQHSLNDHVKYQDLNHGTEVRSWTEVDQEQHISQESADRLQLEVKLTQTLQNQEHYLLVISITGSLTLACVCFILIFLAVCFIRIRNSFIEVIKNRLRPVNFNKINMMTVM